MSSTLRHAQSAPQSDILGEWPPRTPWDRAPKRRAVPDQYLGPMTPRTIVRIVPGPSRD